MPDFTKYEQQHYKNLNSVEKQIALLFANADFELAYFVQATFRGSDNYTDSPLYKAKVQSIQTKLHNSIIQYIANAVVAADKLSSAKSDDVITEITKAKKELRIIWAKEYNTNAGDANKYFALRKKQGFDISDRVWDITGDKISEMADSVNAAIDTGTSAKELAKQIQKYLKNPDKEFRRVRNEKGELFESQARKEYHPGQGVYKSSQANAMRLARTETNIAYRTADSERWKQQEFVTAIDIRLSNSHGKVCDICNYMVGRYPKDFVFKGWHPSCLCVATSVTLNAEQTDKYEDYILSLSNKPTIDYEDAIPVRANDWIAKNAKRINGWKTTPMWVSDNEKYITL